MGAESCCQRCGERLGDELRDSTVDLPGDQPELDEKLEREPSSKRLDEPCDQKLRRRRRLSEASVTTSGGLSEMTDGVMADCAWCGASGRGKCSRCKSVGYCCREHQRLDWNNHRGTCKELQRKMIAGLTASERADMLARLTPRRQRSILSAMDSDGQADTFRSSHDLGRAAMLEVLSTSEKAELSRRVAGDDYRRAEQVGLETGRGRDSRRSLDSVNSSDDASIGKHPMDSQAASTDESEELSLDFSGTGPLGIGFQGGRAGEGDEIVVSDVSETVSLKWSETWRRVQPGMVLRRVQGVSVEGKTHEEVMNLIKKGLSIFSQSSRPLTLVFVQPPRTKV